MVVEVGFVVGTTAATTPTGPATSIKPLCLSSPITPIVLSCLIEFQIYSEAYMFLIALSSTIPRPVSSTAIFAKGMCLSKAAIAISCTMWSTCSCVKFSICFAASFAFAARSSITVSTSMISTSFSNVLAIVNPPMLWIIFFVNHFTY